MATTLDDAAASADPPDFRADPTDRADLRRRRGSGLGIAALLFGAGLLALAWLWWPDRNEQPPAPAAAPVLPAPQAPASAAAGPRFPLALREDAAVAKEGDLAGALAALLGQGTVAELLVLEQFPRRLVATIDNLGREHAPVALWPVQPTAGRFEVEHRGDRQVVAAANAARYRRFVAAVEATDAGLAVDLYLRIYPLLQQAYRGLGFGDRYFNDRVIEVIDLLLATPQASRPLEVELTEVKGPHPSLRPWTRYRFADAQLESLAAGQKLMLRFDAAQQQVLKAKLRQVREKILAAHPSPAAR